MKTVKTFLPDVKSVEFSCITMSAKNKTTTTATHISNEHFVGSKQTGNKLVFHVRLRKAKRQFFFPFNQHNIKFQSIDSMVD